MTQFDLWGKPGPGNPAPRTATPPTLKAELANRQLNRPIVFDPALRQFTAHRAGEPRFDSKADAILWYSCRVAVLHFILSQISQSFLRENLLLRGSAVMGSWFGGRARHPGDLDWVVVPKWWTLEGSNSEQLIKGVVGLADGALIHDSLMIPPGSFVMERIWTYEKAPGVRVVVTWQHRSTSGTVQMDFVFGEEVPSEPVETDITFAGLPLVTLMTASPEQSLAWKLLWLESDCYPMGKDLYDAVLLAELTRPSAAVVQATFAADKEYGSSYAPRLSRESVLNWDIEWDDFVKEYPEITGTADQWKNRLANALDPLFADLDQYRQNSS